MYQFSPESKPKVATLSWGLPTFQGVLRFIFSLVTVAGAAVLGIWLYSARIEHIRAMQTAGPNSTSDPGVPEIAAMKQRETDSGDVGRIAEKKEKVNLSRFKIEPSNTPPPLTKPTEALAAQTPFVTRKAGLSPAKYPTPVIRKPKSVAASTAEPNTTENPLLTKTAFLTATETSTPPYTPSTESFPFCKGDYDLGTDISSISRFCPVYKQVADETRVQSYTLMPDGYSILFDSASAFMSVTSERPEANQEFICSTDPEGDCAHYLYEEPHSVEVTLKIDGKVAKGSVIKSYVCKSASRASCTLLLDKVYVQIDGGYWLSLSSGKVLTGEQWSGYAYILERM